MFKLVDIDATVHGTRNQHVALIYKPRELLLDHPAMWLRNCNNYKTSLEYAKILRRFCDDLATRAEDGFADEDKLVVFWLFVTVSDLTAWMSRRIKTKFLNQAANPQFRTIEREAHIVAKFLDSVKYDCNVTTLWDGRRRKIKRAKAIYNDLLRGIAGPGERDVVDVRLPVGMIPDNKDQPIEGLAKKCQVRAHNYLHDEQMPFLLNSFPDEVFKYITLAAYMTGLRNFEALAIPRWHMFQNGNIFTSVPEEIQNRIVSENSKLILPTLGKGQKLRDVKFDAQSWFLIMKSWEPLYLERKKIYEDKNCKELPLSILWLDRRGNPIYCAPQDPREHQKATKKLQDAFYYVSKKIGKEALTNLIGFKVNYYCLRHTFATNYVLLVMEARKERDVNSYLEDHSLRYDLANQMGHSEIDLTFKRYVDNAIVIIKDREAGKKTSVFPNMEDMISMRR